MERLTTREEHPHGAEGVSKDKLTGRYCRGVFEATACVEKLAEYENDEEDGLLVRLPCKVGDIVFTFSGNEILELEVTEICINVLGVMVRTKSTLEKYKLLKIDFEFSDFGKTVFLTEEAAWERLKKIKGGR